MIIEEIHKLNTNWKDILLEHKEYIPNEFLMKEIETYEPDILIFPPKEHIFRCFNYFNFDELKVVILGQDPYINVGEAMGLCFSVNDNVKTPPSLKNIFKELNTEYNKTRNSSNLEQWAKQGVLLLNTALSVRQYSSNSHKKEWIQFTNKIIEYISKNSKNRIIFVLWGNNAKMKGEFIDKTKHIILESGHPSPLSVKKFLGNNHFIQINEYLAKNKDKQIDWFL